MKTANKILPPACPLCQTKTELVGLYWTCPVDGYRPAIFNPHTKTHTMRSKLRPANNPHHNK